MMAFLGCKKKFIRRAQKNRLLILEKAKLENDYKCEMIMNDKRIRRSSD